MLYMSISGFFANAACGPKAHSDTAPAGVGLCGGSAMAKYRLYRYLAMAAYSAPPIPNALAQIG